MIRREMGHFDWRIPGDVRILIGVICSHHASWLMWFAPMSSHCRPTRLIRVSSVQ